MNTGSTDLLFICCFDHGSRELGLNHLKSLKKKVLKTIMLLFRINQHMNISKNMDLIALSLTMPIFLRHKKRLVLLILLNSHFYDTNLYMSI